MKATPFASASVLAGLASCLMAAVPAVAQPGALQPNIIHIVTDDLGWADVGFHDSDMKTPISTNSRRPEREFEQFYVRPVCTPTRAALMISTTS